MDLTRELFPGYLPWLLMDLSSSCLVAIDLELSGIALSLDRNGARTQTLQQRYDEIKAAAEKYQILQIGLTICREDPQTQTYMLKPYNINLSPVVNQNLKMDRDWNFRGSSVEFLLGNGFSIDAVCQHGVRYLSRDEETHARKIQNQRFGGDQQGQDEDIQIVDQEIQDFVAAVHAMIDKWLAQGEDRWHFLSIPPPVQPSVKSAEGAIPKYLSNMQKRLVHQIICKNYPNLRSRGERNFVQIRFRDLDMEKQAMAGRLEQARATLVKDIGFRWIIEALVGGDLSVLTQHALIPLVPMEPPPGFTPEKLAERLQTRLKENRPVLVGHNCLTDLIYLYRCFIGPLPDTVEEFQIAINELFPMIVDTKYMATHGCSSMNPSSSLEEENRRVAKLTTPGIKLDGLHSKYWYRKLHEAGYDSMLTAVLFIRLSPQLHTRGQLPWGYRGRVDDIVFQMTNDPWPGVAELFPNDGLSPSSGSVKSPNAGRGNHDNASPKETSRGLYETSSSFVTEMVRCGRLIPRLDSEFWKVYGNKLRVFGTDTQVMHLGRDVEAMDETP